MSFWIFKKINLKPIQYWGLIELYPSVLGTASATSSHYCIVIFRTWRGLNIVIYRMRGFHAVIWKTHRRLCISLHGTQSFEVVEPCSLPSWSCNSASCFLHRLLDMTSLRLSSGQPLGLLFKTFWINRVHAFILLTHLTWLYVSSFYDWNFLAWVIETLNLTFHLHQLNIMIEMVVKLTRYL